MSLKKSCVLLVVQEVQVEALLQKTGLSSVVLLHALQPLISEGGPLTCSSPGEPVQGQMLCLCSLTSPLVQLWFSWLSHPCLLAGVLRLNQQVASHSLQDVPASVRLLPRQTYLNVDEDAARTLERKRNIIYCLIVHIMKQEKEMHIDNLVFKVRLFHSWHTVHIPAGLSASCF